MAGCSRPTSKTWTKAYRLEPLISEDYSSIPPIQLHRFDSQKSGYGAEKKPKAGSRGWKILASAYSKMGYRKSKGAVQTADGSSGGEEGEEGEEEEEEGMVIVDHNIEAGVVEREGSGTVAPGDGGESHVSTDGASTSGRSGWISWFGRSSRANSSASAAAQGGSDNVDSPPESEAAKEHVQVPERG